MKKSFFLSALISVFFLIYYRDFFFGPAIFETGDYAANSLKIINAKNFEELYGNYSRWNFNHPGPAFFYIYAFGEFLFHDTIKIFNSPHQSHVFMNMLTQSFFIGLTLSIFHNFSKSWLFVSSLFIVFVIHYYHAPFAIIDIWPPNVLTGPLVALVVSAAALSLGNVTFLPLVILSSCLLVHGHVAQPLFVFPIFLISTFVFVLNREKTNNKKIINRSFLISISIISIFIFPLLIDLLKGSESNINSILQHLKTHSGEPKSFIQSLGYLFSFFFYSYRTGDDIIIGSNLNLMKFILDYISLFLIWFLVLIASIFMLNNDFMKRLNIEEGKFFKNLTMFIFLAIFLTILWGMIQDGSLYAFNAHFNYGIAFLLSSPIVLIISKYIEKASSNISRIGVVFSFILTSLVAIYLQAPSTDSVSESDLSIPKKVHHLLMQAPQKPIFLLFDDHIWPQAIGIALALKREEVPYYVENRWGYPFGVENIIPNNVDYNETDVWYVSYDTNHQIQITPSFIINK